MLGRLLFGMNICDLFLIANYAYDTTPYECGQYCEELIVLNWQFLKYFTGSGIIISKQKCY